MVSYSYWVSFAWGLAVTLSFAGWGAAIARFAGVPEEDRDWALCSCWGMGAITAIGGALALFNLANRAVLIGLAVAGWYLAAIWLRSSLWRCAGKCDWGAPLTFALTLLFFYAPSVASRDVEPYDDYLAYFTFARRFLETGTLIEPFSFRRLLSYGGQSLLHAFTISIGSEKGMHLLDSGIAMLILGGLIYRALRSSTSTLWAVFGSVAILMVPLSRNNVASQATGLILWIAVYLTFRLKARVQTSSQTGSMLLAGLLLAALCSFRSTYTVGVIILCLGLLIAALRKSRALSFPDWWKLVACLSLAVAPWALLSHRSSGTFLYPLFEGYQTAGLGSAFQTTWTIKAQALLHFLANPNVLFLIVPLIAAIMLVRGPHFSLCGPFCAAAIILACAIPWGTPYTEDSLVYRYAQPLAWGAFLIAAAPLIQARKNVAIVLAMLMSPVWAAYAFMTVNKSVASVRSLPRQMADESPSFAAEQMTEYKQLNAALPSGSGVFAIVPLPSLLDYRARRILNADFIGRASLPPGLPFFHGSEELKRYLLAEGLEYIAYNDFDHPAVETGYWRPWWRDRMSSLKPDFAPVVPYVLDLMKNVDELAASEGTMFRTGDLRVIHLSPGGAAVETSAHVPQK